MKSVLKFKVSLLVSSILVGSSCFMASAYAKETISNNFIADFIKIDGLVRVAPETVYAKLPISGGDEVTPVSVANTIKALYAMGHFSNVEASRVGNQLLIKVTERPVITDITFEGNTQIPEVALKKGLEKAGIKKGEPLKQALLDRVEKDLEQQFVSQGRYNADIVIESNIEKNNTVKLNIKFYEGDAAKVVDINIIGNQHFSKSDIEDVFAIKETNWLSFYKKSDRFAKQKLGASLENLRALYLNAGFINFAINNAVINVSEDKKKVFIEISLSEGEQYQFGKTNFLGNPKYNDTELNNLVDIKSKTTFSQQTLTEATQRLERLYGNAGYFFAKIRPMPNINKETKTVDLDFFINPGKPVYVRRINFSGNVKTEDHVLRREMRQLEGALASNEKLDLSKIRLMRTGFFKNVKLETFRVPNASDKVDVTVTVEEQPSGTTSFAMGYSQSGGLTFQAGLTQSNFFGTGNAVNIQLSRSDTTDNYNIGVTNPYFTIDGVSQSYNLYFRKTKTDSRNINNYLTDSIGGSINFGYPVNEDTRLSMGLGVDKTTVKAGNSIAIANLDYLLKNGTDIVQAKPSKETVFTDQTQRPQNFESDFLTYNINAAWTMDTRNKPVFPEKGMIHSVRGEIALPGSDIEYQKATYNGSLYLPLWAGVVLRGYTKMGYGNDLPFYENFSAGGFGSLRGYKNGSLGPTSDSYFLVKSALQGGKPQEDADPEKIGGNALVQGGLALVLPMPFKSDFSDKIRTSLFVEGAQVFDTSKKDKTKFLNTNVNLIKQDKEFRYSAGVSTTFLTPIGPISLSYSEPLNAKKGDDTQQLQFELGRVF